MINHYSIKKPENIEDDVIVLKMEDIPEYCIEDYDLMDEKDRAKYIKDLERIVRNSFEYRNFISYLRENMDMDKCAIMENVTNKDTFKVRIEIHHTPFTLYDICVAVLNRRLALNLPTEIELVAQEVTALHYYLFVGLIPLSKTVHQLVHNSYIFIPLDNVLGNYQSFLDMYRDYISPDLLDTFEENLQYSEKLVKNDLDILKEVPTYIDSSDMYRLPSYSTMTDTMYQRINDIKQLQDPFTKPREIKPGIIWVDD